MVLQEEIERKKVEGTTNIEWRNEREK